MIERTCKGCGDWALCIQGYCGECAPASSVGLYINWWSSDQGIIERAIHAEQAISETALQPGPSKDEGLAGQVYS